MTTDWRGAATSRIVRSDPRDAIASTGTSGAFEMKSAVITRNWAWRQSNFALPLLDCKFNLVPVLLKSVAVNARVSRSIQRRARSHD